MFVQIVFLVICHTILADPLPKPSYDVSNYEIVGHHFEKFIKTFKKKYSPQEKGMRFKIFIENLNEINTLNENHKLATFDIGKFADVTRTEQRSSSGFTRRDDYIGDCKVVDHDPATKDAPAAWDWRDKNAVSPVKDAARCPAKFAFSATAMLESRSLQKGKEVTLSVQQMIDCYGNDYSCMDICFPSLALTKIMQQGGQESEEDYRYEAKNGKCRFDPKKVAVKVTNCTGYSLSGEKALKELLYKEGPLVIGLDIQNWFTYKSGILDKCEYDMYGSSVLLVGYGSEGGEDFWLIKMSWGTDWGEKGFIRVKRGVRCMGIGNNVPHRTLSANVE